MRKPTTRLRRTEDEYLVAESTTSGRLGSYGEFSAGPLISWFLLLDRIANDNEGFRFLGKFLAYLK